MIDQQELDDFINKHLWQASDTRRLDLVVAYAVFGWRVKRFGEYAYGLVVNPSAPADEQMIMNNVLEVSETEAWYKQTPEWYKNDIYKLIRHAIRYTSIGQIILFPQDHDGHRWVVQIDDTVGESIDEYALSSAIEIALLRRTDIDPERILR